MGQFTWLSMGLSCLILLAACGGAADESNNTSDDADRDPPRVESSHKGGVYNTAVTVELSCDDGASTCSIYYTTDGSEPDLDSTFYTGPFSVDSPLTVRYIAVDAAGNLSSVQSEDYVIDVEPPVVSANPPGAAFSAEQTVELACDDGEGSGCQALYYTTDGSVPTAESARYGEPVTLDASAEFRFFATDEAGNASGIATASYLLDVLAPQIVASVPAGAYSQAFSLELSCSESTDCTVYYRAESAAEFSPYTQPVVVDASSNWRAYAMDAAGNRSEEIALSYVIDQTPPTLAVSPAGNPAGPFNEAYTVELTCTDQGGAACAQIRYTTNPDDAEPQWQVYDSPLLFQQSVQIAAIGEDQAGNTSALVRRSYDFDDTAPSVAIDAPAAGGLVHGQYTLQWTTTDDSPTEVTIELSSDGGQSYSVVLAEGVPDNGAFLWDTRSWADGSDYRLRITARDSAGNESAAVEMNGNFVIDNSPPQVTLLRPVGGEHWTGTQPIRWTTADVSDTTISIELSDDGGNTFQSLADSIADDGAFQWNTTNRSEGGNYRVRVRAVDARGQSGASALSAAFTLDHTAPTVAPGWIDFVDNTPNSVTLNWADAFDALTPGSGLEYRVYHADSDLLQTVLQVETYGTPAGPWSTVGSEATVGNLLSAETYYWNVLVRDRAGNTSIYEMARHNTPLAGILDTRFLGTGNFASRYAYGSDVAVDADGRVFLVGRENGQMKVWCMKPQERACSDFGTNGVYVYPQPSAGNAIAVDQSGNVVVAGSVSNGVDQDMALWRLTPAGLPDTSFGNQGLVVHGNAAGGNGHDSAADLAIASSGIIVAVGQSDNGTNTDMAIWSYYSNGIPYSSFGGNGYVVYNNPTNARYPDSALTVDVDRDLNVTVVGTMGVGTGTVWDAQSAIWRYRGNGSLDPNFGSGGWVSFDSAFAHSISDVAYDDQGRLLVTGACDVAGSRDIALLRLNNDGSLDTSFNQSGRVTMHYEVATNTGDSSYGKGVALDDRGNIIVVGRAYTGGESWAGIAWRVRPEGVVDNSFGIVDGYTLLNTVREDNVGGFFIDDAGKLGVGGWGSDTGDRPYALFWRLR